MINILILGSIVLGHQEHHIPVLHLSMLTHMLCLTTLIQQLPMIAQYAWYERIQRLSM